MCDGSVGIVVFGSERLELELVEGCFDCRGRQDGTFIFNIFLLLKVISQQRTGIPSPEELLGLGKGIAGDLRFLWVWVLIKKMGTIVLNFNLLTVGLPGEQGGIFEFVGIFHEIEVDILNGAGMVEPVHR